MYITADILKDLRAIYPTQKLFLLWDKAGWHKGSVAKEFITQDGNIKTLYFPAAAPEENPRRTCVEKRKGSDNPQSLY